MITAGGSAAVASITRAADPVAPAGKGSTRSVSVALPSGVWGQSDVAVTAAAVFSPGDAVSATNLRDGDVTGIDVNGRAVNTASFSGTGQRGWRIATTEYDQFGNTVRELSPANRDRSVYATAATAMALNLPASTASSWLARALDVTSVYAADGIDLVDEFGPYHQVALGGVVSTLDLVSVGVPVDPRAAAVGIVGAVGDHLADHEVIASDSWVSPAAACRRERGDCPGSPDRGTRRPTTLTSTAVPTPGATGRDRPRPATV